MNPKFVISQTVVCLYKSVGYFKRLSNSDLSDIFSLGFTIAQLEKSNDRGIRLEAMHRRGIEDMEEEDIMQYFNEFEPSAIEWIDDESCKFIY